MVSGHYGDDNDTDWLKIRGFDQATYQDGLRIYREGFYQWLPETYGLERVEMLKGPASILYGEAPPGGVMYLAENGVSPYVSYTESFQPIAGTDGNGDLYEPRTGEQIELGVKIAPRNLDGYVTAAVYRIEEENSLGEAVEATRPSHSWPDSSADPRRCP